MYMIVRVQPPLCFAKCIQQRGVFVSVYSYIGVWRYHLSDKHDKSLRFSCIHRSNIYLLLTSGDLQALVMVYDYKCYMYGARMPLVGYSVFIAVQYFGESCV